MYMIKCTALLILTKHAFFYNDIYSESCNFALCRQRASDLYSLLKNKPRYATGVTVKDINHCFWFTYIYQLLFYQIDYCVCFLKKIL